MFQKLLKSSKIYKSMEHKVTKEDVKHVAMLCKLELSDQELEKFSQLFTETIQYISTLDELDTSKVKETYQVTGLTNVYGTDNVATLSKEAALCNATQIQRDLFVTKAVLTK